MCLHIQSQKRCISLPRHIHVLDILTSSSSSSQQPTVSNAQASSYFGLRCNDVMPDSATETFKEKIFMAFIWICHLFSPEEKHVACLAAKPPKPPDQRLESKCLPPGRPFCVAVCMNSLTEQDLRSKHRGRTRALPA